MNTNSISNFLYFFLIREAFSNYIIFIFFTLLVKNCVDYLKAELVKL